MITSTTPTALTTAVATTPIAVKSKDITAKSQGTEMVVLNQIKTHFDHASLSKGRIGKISGTASSVKLKLSGHFEEDVKLSSNTLCTCWLSKGCISTVPVMPQGIQIIFFIAASISTTFTFATTSVAATTTTELNQDSWEWPKHRM